MRRAGEVAHDLNNLLTVILGGTATLREEVAPGLTLEVVAEIEEAGRRASELTRELLALARDASGRGASDEPG